MRYEIAGPPARLMNFKRFESLDIRIYLQINAGFA